MIFTIGAAHVHRSAALGIVSCALVIASPSRAGAQGASSTAAAGSPACFAKIPPKDLSRVTVYANATVRDSLNRRVPALATKLLQQVVPRVQALLGATGNGLADGEPQVHWWELDPAIYVTGFRDGHVNARVRGDSAGVIRPLAAGARLIVRALNEEKFQWPESFGDSVVFRVDMDRPTIDSDGKVKPIAPPPPVPFGTESATPVAIFTVNAPRHTEVQMRRAGSIQYPAAPRAAKEQGTITFSYVVDSTGRADMSTVKDVWPAGVERPSGTAGTYYRDFVLAVRGGIEGALYRPATEGGCPIRELVRQQFVFGFR